jgi:hypothetical protein
MRGGEDRLIAARMEITYIPQRRFVKQGKLLVRARRSPMREIHEPRCLNPQAPQLADSERSCCQDPQDL